MHVKPWDCRAIRQILAGATSAIIGLAAASASAGLDLGTLNDFESGTLEGWLPTVSLTNIASGGPLGAADHFLQISTDAFGGNLAAYTTGPSGAIDPGVGRVDIDMMRLVSEGDLEVRLTFVGPTTNDRWTSTLSVIVPDDGVWRTYSFSSLEGDLTQTLGTNNYAALQASLNRLLLRYDPGPPSAAGEGGSGLMNIDNVYVPEPSAGLAGLTSLMLLAALRRPVSRVSSSR